MVLLTRGEAQRGYADAKERVCQDKQHPKQPASCTQHCLQQNVSNAKSRKRILDQIRTLQNPSEVHLAIVNAIVEPTIRPPSDNENDTRSSMYVALRVYGSSVEFAGGSVVQKVAIVVRSNPACAGRAITNGSAPWPHPLADGTSSLTTRFI